MANRARHIKRPPCAGCGANGCRACNYTGHEPLWPALDAAVKLFHETWGTALGCVAVGAGVGEIIVYLKTRRALRTALRVGPKHFGDDGFPVVYRVSGQIAPARKGP